MNGHFSNHFLNRDILVLLSCGVMYQSCMCFFLSKSLSVILQLIFSIHRISAALSSEMEFFG